MGPPRRTPTPGSGGDTAPEERRAPPHRHPGQWRGPRGFYTKLCGSNTHAPSGPRGFLPTLSAEGPHGAHQTAGLSGRFTQECRGFTRGLRASDAPEPRGGSVPAARYTGPDRGLPACQSGWNLPTGATAEAGGRHPRSGEPASQATQGGGAGWGSVAPTPRACVRRGTAVLPHLSHRADRCTRILDVTGCPLRKKHVPG